MDSSALQPNFPNGLLDWAGHRGGGVRRPFHSASGRPSGAVIETPLLSRLSDWATSLAAGTPGTPRAVLLVGGPGNGKTEAVEQALQVLDAALGMSGSFIAGLEMMFSGQDGQPVPRLVRLELFSSSNPNTLRLVQDASVNDASMPGKPPRELFVEDLEQHVVRCERDVYLACVNRGVLDEALIWAIDHGRADAQKLLESVIKAVGMSPNSPACWPLEGYTNVAVWPMDVESLVGDVPAQQSPAMQLITVAVDATKWPVEGACPAGERCPHCISRGLLAIDEHVQNITRVLRWHELATGKRWSFRDLFSLLSYLLAGVGHSEGDRQFNPCEWAQRQMDLSQRTGSRSEPARYRAPFALMAAQYQHALFCIWPRLPGRGLRPMLKELGVDSDAGLLGLHYFLGARGPSSMPPTLGAQLLDISDALDPAVADPHEVITFASTDRTLRDIDARFSQSVADGFAFVRRWLSPLEADVLQLLKASDELLATAEVRRRRPAGARRLQHLVREFSCRLVRRSLGVRYGIVKDRQTLSDFGHVVAGNVQILHETGKHVEALLNDRDRFVVSLNTTFGEPLPPQSRRAFLTTRKQRVRSVEPVVDGRPMPAVRFFSVGTGSQAKPIALTYDLFRSVRELRTGMLPASLPRPVVALLDTTRARLAGLIVRDDEAIDESEIHVGARGEIISRELGEFVVRGDNH